MTNRSTISPLGPRPILPSRDRAHWWDETGKLPLCYLAWGARNYSSEAISSYRCGGWQYILVQSGNPIPPAEGALRSVQAGTLLVIGPDHAFGWRAGRGKLLNWMWKRPVTPEVRMLPPDSITSLSASDESISELEDIHAWCRKEVTSLDSFSPTALHGCQALLEALILRRMQPSADSIAPQARRLVLAQRWIAEHLDSQEPIARLCDYLDVSPATLHRDFVRQTGVSAADFHHKLKMQTAFDLIREGCSSKQAAATLGYRCFNDFSRAVHRYFGRPPSKLQ